MEPVEPIEEADFSNFGKTPAKEVSSKQKTVQGAVFVDQDEDEEEKKRKWKFIYWTIIALAIITVFLEWYFFIRVPKSDEQATLEQIRQALPDIKLK